jgi:hypothetical protein
LIGGLLFTMKVPVGSSLIEKVWSTYAMFSSRSIPRRFQLHQNTPKKNLTETPVSENYKSQNPPGNSTLTITEWNQIERTPPDASTLVPPCYATITRENNKIRQQRKTPRVGCLLHPLHVLSKPTKNKTRHDERSSSSSFAG